MLGCFVDNKRCCVPEMGTHMLILFLVHMVKCVYVYDR